MKPILQQLPSQLSTPFLNVTHKSLKLEANWHKHEAYELVLIEEGNGLAYIGNYETTYTPGNIFFLGSQLPHRFQPNKTTGKALTIQFKDDCLGKEFINLPECLQIKQLLTLASKGLQIKGQTRNQLHTQLQILHLTNEVTQIISFLQCLHILSSNIESYVPLNISDTTHSKKEECIDKILRYTKNSFYEPVTLSHVAAIACKSIPSFCHYFKRATQKTYIDYLNEVRIEHACRQLKQTQKPIIDIGYESGYNTVAHFYRQFFRLIKTTPLQYRKLYSHPKELYVIGGQNSNYLGSTTANSNE